MPYCWGKGDIEPLFSPRVLQMSLTLGEACDRRWNESKCHCYQIKKWWGFHIFGVPKNRWFMSGKSPCKIRMMTGGSPIFGNPQVFFMNLEIFLALQKFLLENDQNDPIVHPFSIHVDMRSWTPFLTDVRQDPWRPLRTNAP